MSRIYKIRKRLTEEFVQSTQGPFYRPRFGPLKTSKSFTKQAVLSWLRMRFKDSAEIDPPLEQMEVVEYTLIENDTRNALHFLLDESKTPVIVD